MQWWKVIKYMNSSTLKYNSEVSVLYLGGFITFTSTPLQLFNSFNYFSDWGLTHKIYDYKIWCIKYPQVHETVKLAPPWSTQR